MSTTSNNQKNTQSLQAENSAAHYYYNRELSWLDFNYRCVEEASDPNNPLLEQLNFLGIVSSNLDEFIMVRFAGVYNQYLDGVQVAENKTQMSPKQLMQGIHERNTRNVEAQYARYHDMVELLDEKGYHLKSVADLNEAQKAQVKEQFEELILPTLTAIGIDAYRPFPHLKNHALNILVELEKDQNSYIAVVPIPTLLKRYLTLDDGEGKAYVLVEDVIIHGLNALFKGYTIKRRIPFRIARNADFELNEDDVMDLLDVMEDHVKNRLHGKTVRIEWDTRWESPNDHNNEDFLATVQPYLKVPEEGLYPINGPLDLTFLFDLVDDISEDHPEWKYPDFEPVEYPNYHGENLYQLTRKGDLFFHHPYDSFKPILSFVDHAASDPKTVAIKMTLYRVSKHSPIVKSLKKAAENGKEVTVLVELKARFDEENNVHWARELEEAGCHVLYGLSELKTHSKITLVVRREAGKIQRYIHLGTGNYNDKTAKQYTDMGILSTNEALTSDGSKFFNFLSGYSEVPDYEALHVSPFAIRDSLTDYIDEEIENQKKYGNGRIIAKMNSLTDKPLIKKLYEASQAGVQIDLIIRGICCLRPQVEGLSENIRVRSIVGRFLEHSRIYYFYRNGQKHVFLSSADMMTRNMIRRVEIEFPIIDQDIEAQIIHFLEVELADNQKARELGSDGVYRHVKSGDKPINSQEQMMQEAESRRNESVMRITPSSPNFFKRMTRFLTNRHKDD
ncbi:RNA degradosome polyphosphate kinase [Aerococcus urinae]